MTHHELSRDLPERAVLLVAGGSCADLDSCPYAGRPLPRLERRIATSLDEPIESS
jgi:hypothetical protein